MSYPTASGFLNISKPSGPTSFQAVASVRRVCGVRRVGHAGTLDPAASGVLPIALGQATRLIEYLHEASKTYHALIELGMATDTYDASGQVLLRSDPSAITLPQFQAALSPFQGTIWQTPPPYSAVHSQGHRLHELARAGIQTTPPPRQVEVYRLEIASWQPPFVQLEVECGKGTYIRSLAHDLGQALGCGAYLKGLERIRYGPFHLSDAIALDKLEGVCQQKDWQELLYPLEEVLLSWEAAVVGSTREKAILTGQAVIWGEDSAPAQRCRVYSLEGHFLAVLRFQEDKGLWQPEKVFSYFPEWE